MERIAMTQEERDWLDTLKRVHDGLLTQREAAQRMGITERGGRSLVADLRERGDVIVVLGLSGRESNRRIDEKTREKALEILGQPDWHDCVRDVGEPDAKAAITGVRAAVATEIWCSGLQGPMGTRL